MKEPYVLSAAMGLLARDEPLGGRIVCERPAKL